MYEIQCTMHEITITPPRISRFHSNLVQSFIRSQAIHYRCSRSKIKGQFRSYRN